MSKSNRLVVLGLATLAGGIGLQQPAFAAPVAESTGSDSAELEEITVTAQRREERTTDIPMAIAAVSGASLANSGVTTIASLQQVAPSFQIASAGGDPIIAMRGIGTVVNQIAGEASVSVSEDGVPFARQQYLLGAFLDVDRVEVLRGPQGTISGRNATGGAINIISRRPTDKFEGTIDVTGGNYHARDVTGFFSGPLLGDKLMARIAFDHDDRDGWLKDTVTGRRYADEHKTMARASFLTKPTDAFEGLLTLEYYSNRSVGFPFVSLGPQSPVNPTTGPVFGTVFPTVPGPYVESDQHTFQMAEATDQYFRQKMRAATLQMKWDIAPLTSLKSVSGYRKFDIGWQYESARIPESENTIIEPFHQHQLSQEFTLTSAVGDNFDWLIGGIYLFDHAEVTTGVIYIGGPLAGQVNLSFHDTQILKSGAGYTQIRWRFAPKWQLTVGDRYTKDKKDWMEQLSFPALAPPTVRIPASRSWSASTPRVAVDFKPQDNVTVYASFSRGFKAGGFSDGAALGPLGVNPFEPETVKNYEVGAKTRWLENRLAANMAAFWADYKDLQQVVFVAPSPRTENATSARVKGVELELNSRPTDRIELGLSTTWLDPRYGTYFSLNPGRPDIVDINQSGKQLTTAPKFSAAANASYEFYLGTGRLTLRADYSWQSKVFFTQFNENILSQNSYGLLNLRATLTSADEHWRVSAWATNVADKSYLSGGSSNGNQFLYLVAPNIATAGFPLLPNGLGLMLGANAAGVLGNPRMYGITLGYSF